MKNDLPVSTKEEETIVWFLAICVGIAIVLVSVFSN